MYIVYTWEQLFLMSVLDLLESCSEEQSLHKSEELL